MNLRAIPDPILTPIVREQRVELKPLASIPIPPSTPPPAVPADKKAVESQPEPARQRKKQELPPLIDAAPLGQIEGQDVPLPFKPVDPLTALGAPNPTLAFLMLRQLRDMNGPMPDTSGGALAVMEKLEVALKNGEDVTVLANEINNFILGEEEHSELINRLSSSLDRQRLIEIFKSRAKWEDFCHACIRRGDLSIIEGMAVMSQFNSELKTIFARIDQKGRSGEPVQSRESLELVERINRPTIAAEKEIQRKFSNVPPQEREILRKVAFKLETALAARITKTTTETVEIVQQPVQNVANPA